jgi:hypothetical protein
VERANQEVLRHLNALLFIRATSIRSAHHEHSREDIRWIHTSRADTQSFNPSVIPTTGTNIATSDPAASMRITPIDSTVAIHNLRPFVLAP